MLTDIEKNRYQRHFDLEKVGESGQEKLKTAKVLVIGAGGLGCPALQYLTAAGIGTIGIVDFDVVEESNLQRQILFCEDDIGLNKAEVAATRLKKLNQFVNFQVYPEKLDSNNALSLFSEYDLILDGTDNFATRYLINDASLIVGKPFVYGSVFRFEGSVSVFNYQNGPSYRCYFPEAPQNDDLYSCNLLGVLGVLPGIIGIQQANEVLKIVLELGSVLSGTILFYNSLNAEYTKIQLLPNEEEKNKVLANKETFQQNDYELFCKSAGSNESHWELNEDDFFNGIENAESLLIDVRESHELPKINKNEINIPLVELPKTITDLDRNKTIFLFCQSGKRSKIAAELFLNSGFKKVYSLKLGILGETKIEI